MRIRAGFLRPGHRPPPAGRQEFPRRPLWRRRPHTRVGRGVIEAQQCVIVHRAACLPFGDLHIGDPNRGPALPFGQTRHMRHPPVGQIHRAFPQPARTPIPDDQTGIVVTIRTDSLPDQRIILAVDPIAAVRPPVSAAAPPWPAHLRRTVIGPTGMHRTERGSGHRHEQPRMGGHPVRDTGTADHARVHDLPGVPRVQVGARRADRHPPVPTRHQDHPVG